MSTAIPQELSVGDPRRTLIGRAARGVPMAALVFLAFTWSAKELPALYRYEPWQDDPYDAMVSFAMSCVPLLVGLCALRVPLCRRYRPLPVRRVVDLLRVSRVLLVVVLVTLAGDWISVAAAAHPADWGTTTAALIAALALVTALALAAALCLRRASREPLWRSAPAQPDWLSDAVALGEREARRLGRWRDPAVGALRWLDRELLTRIRRYPLYAAAVFSIGLGAAIDAPQIILEGYAAPLGLLFVAISACSVFAFVVIAGAYLRVVGREPSATRPAVLALVVACASVPLAASFRGALWWALGTTEQQAGVAQLAQLVLVAALSTGVATLGAVPLLRALRR